MNEWILGRIQNNGDWKIEEETSKEKSRSKNYTITKRGEFSSDDTYKIWERYKNVKDIY